MKRFTLFVLAVLLFSLTGCGGGATSYSTSLEVEMKEFMFEPTDFTVPAGKEISIQLVNDGAIKHEFVIMKLGTEVSVPFGDDDEGNIYWEHEVDAGKTETVTFTAPSEPGEYQVICGISGHMEAGMVAKLTVVNP
jgi:uncharacterized cupredoxin-like copper-binding protein